MLPKKTAVRLHCRHSAGRLIDSATREINHGLAHHRNQVLHP